MDKAGLNREAIFQQEDVLLEQIVKNHSSNQLNLEKEIRQLGEYYQSLKNISETVDETLAQHVESLHSKALKGVVELEKKILRAEKRNFEEVRTKIREIRGALFPLNGLQERIENFIPWYAQYGKEFINLIYENAPTLEGKFTVLEEQ
jgi:uncharacterized protein YllA (UPF0747 family)